MFRVFVTFAGEFALRVFESREVSREGNWLRVGTDEYINLDHVAVYSVEFEEEEEEEEEQS